jgi:hypothetical protein
MDSSMTTGSTSSIDHRDEDHKRTGVGASATTISNMDSGGLIF